MKLSIIIPVFNEQDTIIQIISMVRSVQIKNIIEKEIIIIDDCSTDNTKKILLEILNEESLKIKFEKKNKGKGFAIRRGLGIATGDIILIQDADLEYNPNQYPKLLNPILNGDADVVYGSRFVGGDAHRVLFFWHYLGNKFLTLLSNIMTDLNLSDMECCYKVFKKSIIDKIKLKENRFGIEPEITAKVAKLAKNEQCRIYEIGIEYFGRTYADGKKITWRDGFSAIRCIFYYRFFD